MRAIDRWNALPEEEKLNECLQYSLNVMQGKLLNHENDEMFNGYCEMLRAQIDWISIKIGSDPLPLYSGPGRNNTKDFHDRLNEGQP